MAYLEVWDETKPAGSRALNLGDDDIREFKRALRERFAAGGMRFPSTDDSNAGLFENVKFIEQSANPTQEANRGFLFTKDVSTITELFWMDSSGNVLQLTSAGKILISKLFATGEINKDLIRHNGTNWDRFPWATLLTELQTDLNFGGARNSYSNLRVIRLNNTQVQVTADELTVVNTSNQKQSLSSVNVTADITVSGVNGLDTGVEANSTWYAVWVIYNGTTKASLLSTSYTAPTMPAGYTYKALVGAVRNDSAGNFVDFEIVGDDYFYLAWPTLVSGTTADVLTLVDTSDLVPSALSKSVYIQMWNTANRLMIANLSTVSTNTTVNDANKFHSEPDEGAHFFFINIITANTLWWSSNHALGTIRVVGFKLNRR